MKKELESKLFENYPLLYRDRQRGPRTSLMYFGFAFSNGWYDIVNELSAKIEKEIIRLRDEENVAEDKLPTAFQAKEKFSSLSFYMQNASGNKVITEAIRETAKKSATTCEYCGKPGELRKGRWLKTRCDTCEEEKVRAENEIAFNLDERLKMMANRAKKDSEDGR